LVLLAGALASPLLARRRAVAGVASATALALLLWANAPLTGRGDPPVLDKLALTTTRYLLPAIATAALALALAARERTVARWIATLLLTAALAWSVLENLGPGFPITPSGKLLAVASAAGAALGWAAGWVARQAAERLPARRPRVARIAPATACVLAAGALTLPASGYVRRHAATWVHPISQLSGWFASRTEFADGARPIAMAATVDGLLAGDRLRHPLELIPANEPCAGVRTRLRRGWVVVSVLPRLPAQGGPKGPLPELGSAGECLRDRRPAYAGPFFLVYEGWTAEARERGRRR